MCSCVSFTPRPPSPPRTATTCRRPDARPAFLPQGASTEKRHKEKTNKTGVVRACVRGRAPHDLLEHRHIGADEKDLMLTNDETRALCITNDLAEIPLAIDQVNLD